MTDTLSGSSPVSLEAVLCTEELHRRPARAPDYETENRLLRALTQALVDSPSTILQVLAEKILEGLGADSAGVSILAEDNKNFFWPAVAGAWQPHVGGGAPRDLGPCGDVLDRNTPLLFTHFERRYTDFLPTTPPAEECLLVPFYVGGKAVGTIWAIAHDGRRKFDAEDLRRLESLGAFASAAYQADINVALEQRRLALQLEQAVHAGQSLETLNTELRASHDALRRSEGHLRDFVDNAAVGLHWVGADGAILWANQTELDLLGYTQDEYFGHNIADFHADERVIADMLARLTGGEALLDYEARVRCRDGSILHVLISSNALFENGQFVHTRCFTRDVTERKQAENLLRRNHDTFFNLIQNSPFGLYVVDAQLRMRQVSTASEKVFRNIRPLIGRNFDDVMRTLWPEAFVTDVMARFRHTLETGEAYAMPNFTEQRRDIADVESYDWKIERITLQTGNTAWCAIFTTSPNASWPKMRCAKAKRSTAALSKAAQTASRCSASTGRCCRCFAGTNCWASKTRRHCSTLRGSICGTARIVAQRSRRSERPPLVAREALWGFSARIAMNPSGGTSRFRRFSMRAESRRACWPFHAT